MDRLTPSVARFARSGIQSGLSVSYVFLPGVRAVKNSLTVLILGPTEVVGPRGPAVLTGTRQRALVALLALNAGNVVTASRLVDAMYGENPPRTAIRTVQ